MLYGEQLGGATAWLKRGHDLRLAELKTEAAAARLLLQQAESFGPEDSGVQGSGSEGVQGDSSGAQGSNGGVRDGSGQPHSQRNGVPPRSTILRQQAEAALEAEVGRVSEQLLKAAEHPSRLVIFPVMGVGFVRLIREYYILQQAQTPHTGPDRPNPRYGPNGAYPYSRLGITEDSASADPRGSGRDALRARMAEQLLPHTRVFLDAASESYREMEVPGLEACKKLRLMAEKSAAEIAGAWP